jgi:hypothetical protein
MDKKLFTQQVSLGTNGTSLIIAQTTFNEHGLQDQRKQAIINIMSDDPKKTLKEASQYLYNLHGRPNITNGFVQNADQVRKLQAGEIKKVTPLNNGYLLTLEVEEDVLTSEIAQSAPGAVSAMSAEAFLKSIAVEEEVAK